MSDKAHAKKEHLAEMEEAPHVEDDEGWIVSYADMMTLLFGFFAMMFTYATFDEDDSIKMHREVAKYFGGAYMTPTEKLSEKIQFEWRKSPYGAGMEGMRLVQGEEGVEITFVTSLVFESGSADLKPNIVEPLNVLMNLIRTSGVESKIIVEGHTDDNPIGSSRFPSNWELSAARAASIVRLFQTRGFRADLLAATGYGDSRPAFPNRDADGKPLPENQARNRRVLIKVVPVDGKKIEKKAPAAIPMDSAAHGAPAPEAPPAPAQSATTPPKNDHS